MNRRHFINSSLLSLGALALPRPAFSAENPGPENRVSAVNQDPVSDLLSRASWLRDPRFKNTRIGDYLSLVQWNVMAADLVGTAENPRNLHTYFRKEIWLEKEPVDGTLYVTGDDFFKLYLNGEFALEGPERSYAFAQPYFAVPLKAGLKRGRNCLAAHVYYHGCYTRAYTSGDNRSGFLMALEVVYADGSKGHFMTDATWRCLRCATFSASHMLGYASQYNENMDLRKDPAGWREAGFDDATWEVPFIERQDHELIPAMTLPLVHWRADPVTMEERGAGRWFCDFGRELVGHTRITVPGEEGRILTILHAEELNADGTLRSNLRCNCKYRDEITLPGRTTTVEFFDYRGFRYVEIQNSPTRPEVWVDVRHYAFKEEASAFACSAPLLNEIWKMSKHGIRLGCQDVFVDTPQREKGQYLGDTYMMVLSQLILTGDPALTRKAIRDFQLTQRFDSGLLGVAPSGFRQEICEWSLLWPVLLQHYFWMTGDREFSVRMVNAGLERLLAWFAKMENPDGLLTGIEAKKWVLVDWPANLRGGYDYDRTKNDVNTVVNAFYYAMLQAAAELMRLAGRDASAIELRAGRLRGALVGQLVDPTTKLFRDGANSAHHSLHASGFPLSFGLVTPELLPSIVQLMREKRLDCGLYGAHYFIEGLFKAEQHELAYELLTSRDDHSWAEMLRHGATTPLEAWAPDQKRNLSFCEPAGATPIYLLVRYVMGLAPGSPGWKSVNLLPRVPEKLEWMKVTFPTVNGSITADYAKDRGYRLTVPKGVEVKVIRPDAMHYVIQEG